MDINDITVYVVIPVLQSVQYTMSEAYQLKYFSF